MQPTEDSALLRQYAENNSDEAFAALVTRHVNLVYSVALRQTGNPHHAEEITQAVFIILAKKAASLRHEPALSSWLFQATRLTANNFIRSEVRRHRREEEAYMQSVLDETGTDAWPQIAPLLDTAVAGLREKDRQAIVLRFYEGRNLREIGLAQGTGEDAAEKRVSRALDKLRAFFTKRGVSSTSAIIAGAMTAHSVQAAPVALAKSVTAMAMAKGAAASGSTLTLIKGALKIMAWTKAKIAAVTGAALILTTGTSIVAIKAVHSERVIHLPADALPQTLAELNAWYVEPPAGQNAATFNLQGIRARQISGADQNANLPILGKLPTPSPGAPLPVPVKSALATFVQRNRAALQFFAQGAQYEQSRYPIDFNQGQKMQMPHLQKIKSGTQMTEMAAILDAEDKQGKQAADDVLLTLALARSLKAEPMLISQLVREASVAIATAALEQVINRVTLPPESLSELSKAFQNMEDYDARGEGFNRSLIGEKVMVMAAFKNANLQDLTAFAASDATDEQRQQMARHLKQPGGLKDEEDYLKTTFEQFLTARKEDFPGRLKNAAAIQQHAAEATNGVLLLNNSWLTGYAGLVSKEAGGLANLRLALTAVALEQFRAGHNNRYPAILSELTPDYLSATPLDPFDGQPLRYRQQGAGYVLYSIGPDLKDDGGKRMKGKDGDMVFSVTPPPVP
jgi:RNA polymerase sigma factor (sigma-70 family)